MDMLALRLYSWLVWLAQPLVRRKLRRRARDEPGYATAVAERFGHYAPDLASAAATLDTNSFARQKFIWIHAVSLGETRGAAVLLKALRVERPGMRLLLTHGTATGREEGKNLLQPGDIQVWLPWDTRGAVDSFLRTFQPMVGLLMETEVWPNLVAGCRARGVPLVLVNARLSKKSFSKAMRVPALSRPAYAGLAAVWPQTEADAHRLRQLGAPVQRVLGNLKFDADPEADQLQQGRAWRHALHRPVLMLASSREGEEASWLENFKRNVPLAQDVSAPAAIKKEANPLIDSVRWLIVPRHPQRFDGVYQLLTDAGLRVARRSQWEAPPPDVDVWLGDTLGEMALYYGMADVALLGGSFAPLGGQNLIEAAACQCPVVVGPHAYNFEQAVEQACAAGAALQVSGMGAGIQAAREWASDPIRLTAARANAARFAHQHRGAAKRTVEALKDVLSGLT